MGMEERARRSLTLEARREIDAHNERVLGPLLEHGAHHAIDDAGGAVQFKCPACGHGEAVNQFCPGKVELLPDQVEQPCLMHGPHLHTICKGCGYAFRRKCANWQPGDTGDEPVSALAP